MSPKGGLSSKGIQRGKAVYHSFTIQIESSDAFKPAIRLVIKSH